MPWFLVIALGFLTIALGCYCARLSTRVGRLERGQFESITTQEITVREPDGGGYITLRGGEHPVLLLWDDQDQPLARLGTVDGADRTGELSLRSVGQEYASITSSRTGRTSLTLRDVSGTGQLSWNRDGLSMYPGDTARGYQVFLLTNGGGLSMVSRDKALLLGIDQLRRVLDNLP